VTPTAAIIRSGGCYGVTDVDHAMAHGHDSLGNLDYLTLVAMHTTAVLREHPDS
jgi:hypothetical protein